MTNIAIRIGSAVAAICFAATMAPAQAISPAGAPNESPVGCELHFWPSEDAQSNSNPFSGRALDNIADPGARTTGNVLLDTLPIEAQLASLQQLDLAELLDLPGVRVVYENGRLSRRDATRNRARLTSSTAPCYAELMVKRIGYRNDPLFGRDFGAVFIYRRFASGGTEATIFQGDGDVGLDVFPAADESEQAAAEAELFHAFGVVFEEFVDSRLRRSSRR